MSNAEVFITNIAAFLPNSPVENSAMESILGQVGPKPSRARRTILRSNGIKQRYYAIDPTTGKHNYTNASLTASAAKALQSANFSLDEIQCLACGTSIPDQLMPNHSVMVQGELGLNACEVVATAGVCLAGMTALKYAYTAVRSGEHDNAIACGSELASASMSANNFASESSIDTDDLERRPELAFDKDFLRWMLSDGAGAALLENKPNNNTISLKIEWIDILSYAGEMEACMYAGATKEVDGSLRGWAQYSQQQRNELSVMSVKQDVKLLNDNVIHYTVEKPLAVIAKKRQLNADDITYFLPHYSSTFFRDKVYDGIKKAGVDIPQERWFSNLSSKGNTGSASIYIMLEELFHSGRLKNGDKILCYIPESGRFSTSFMLLTAV